MTFPDTVEEFMEQYKTVDTEQIYSNGIEYVPIFRMRQWFEHKPERKKGKWIDMSDGGRIKTLWAEKYKCDKCGMYGTRAWKFCPYCGADMRGEE